MFPSQPDELNGKTIERVEVYTDRVVFKVAGEDKLFQVKLVDGEVRLLVMAKLAYARSPAVRVYRGDGPFAGEEP
jgi:hypothetical protein